MKKSSIIHKRIYLFPRGEDGVLTLLVCVLMTAALILSVYLCFERSDLSAPEKTGTQEELLLDPETAGLPLIRIWTDDGRPPTFSVADTPEGLMGQTITDNTYKKGICTIENVSSLPRFSSRMKLKVRGNASAIVAGADGKLQYKLVLDAPVGLFEDETAETRFILLADAGANLKTWLGFRIGELCGMDWTLKSRYVNLVLNDEYRGLYLLTEAKDGSSLREHIGDGGFLIESDAYWWNEDVYFHSKFLTETMAFTIQYPELTDRNDRRLKEIETHMEQIGENILRGDLEDIDLNTFCAWIIAKDLLDDTDAAGSNIYFYSYVLSSGRESAHQLKMGPLWDLDASFGRPPDPDRKEGWSPLHSAGFTCFPELFQNREFLDIYCSRMAEIRASLYDSCSSLLTSLCDELEGPIDASREADANRWGKSWTPVREEAEERLQWLSERSAWIGSQLVPIPKKNGELEYRRFITDVSDDCETLTIALYDDGYERVRFPTWSDENGQDDIVWYEAELNEDRFWEAVVPLSRHHSGGFYQIHVYATGNGEETFIKNGIVYVEFAVEPQLAASISDDAESMTISFRDNGYERVQFPTWSDENGQDDIVWYEAELDASGRWTVTVDLRRHKPGDAYTVHVYVADGGELVFADWTHIA